MRVISGCVCSGCRRCSCACGMTEFRVVPRRRRGISSGCHLDSVGRRFAALSSIPFSVIPLEAVRCVFPWSRLRISDRRCGSLPRSAIFRAVLAIFVLISCCIPIVHPKKVILLDTANSTTELRWKTFSNIDEDDIGWLEETYRGVQGLENLRAYVVCNVEHPDVDNWLRTPRIERGDARRMHVEITFTMRDCTEFPGNARSCKETFRLYATQLAAGEHFRDNDWSDSQWDLIDRITADTGRHSKHDSSSAVNEEVRSYSVTKHSVYFAFRDSGACVSVLNVKVFYEVCPETTRSFVHFPQTVTGAEAHSIIAVQGTCVANASPRGVSKQPTFVCKATGSWDMPNGDCVCNAGFVAATKHNTCTACPAGSYKPLNENECRGCPEHSNSVSPASSQCLCDVGFYRADGETVDEHCTQPPSKPSRLSVTKLESTSAVVEWDEPLNLGGRKEVWYRYQCASCPESVRSVPREETFTERRLQLTGLHPGSAYTVMIFAENRISRMLKGVGQYGLIEFSTRPEVAMLVGDLRVDGILDNGVTIAWKPPTPTQGLSASRKQIVYEIEARHNGTVSVAETVHVYHTFDNLDAHFPYSFKVRALTELGWGSWSDALWYQPGRGQLLLSSSLPDSFPSDTGLSNRWLVSGPPVWVWVLFGCVFLFILLCLILVCSRRSKANRKHFSDCDGLDPYKNGTLTPDYNTPSSQGITQKLFHSKLGAPLITSGVQHSACYGNARFKPYVDPTAYEDPNQALSEFANDIDPACIRITDVIGSGEFGEVCKGVLQPRIGTYDLVKTVAIKTLKPGSSGKAKADFLMEASIMGQFEHENVIRLIGVATKSEPVMIVTEYMENGSLDQFLRKHDNGEIRIAQIVEMLKGIAAGMKYLTAKGFVHRDLAARNVLVDSKLWCKIADFGLSRGLEGSVEQEYTTNGGKIPVRWTAPEAITHRKFTAASDVWSFGVLMWEVCSFGERPYWEWTNQKVISEISAGYRLPAPMDTPCALHTLMLRCWHIERHQRPTFGHILYILEEFLQRPDLLYAQLVPDFNDSAVCAQQRSVTADGTGSDGSPPCPLSITPPVGVEEFVKRLGLAHCLPKLRLAGVHTLPELSALTQLDFLSYGFIADEALRIRDALHRLAVGVQKEQTLRRPIDQHGSDCGIKQGGGVDAGISVPLSHSPSSLTRPRIGTLPQTVSSAVTAGANDGFFV